MVGKSTIVGMAGTGNCMTATGGIELMHILRKGR